MESKKRYPSLCSWCQRRITGQDIGRRAPLVDPPSGYSTYRLEEHFDNDGKDNYPDKRKCPDYELDKDVTLVDAYWWPLAWATKEFERLKDKLAMMNSNDFK